jgi:hypothetical protein
MTPRKSAVVEAATLRGFFGDATLRGFFGEAPLQEHGLSATFFNP